MTQPKSTGLQRAFTTLAFVGVLFGCWAFVAAEMDSRSASQTVAGVNQGQYDDLVSIRDHAVTRDQKASARRHMNYFLERLSVEEIQNLRR